MNLHLYRLIHNERGYKRYYCEPLKHDTFLNRIAYEAKVSLGVYFYAITLPFNKKYNNIEWGGVKKSRFKIMIENLIWAFKYKEVCWNYFVYGLDNIGRNPDDYMAYTEFRVIRNIINIRLRENIRTGYTFNYLALVRDKFIFYQYCKSLGMPYPHTIALLYNGKINWYDDGIMNEKDISSILDRNFTAFCKETTGEGGKGAFVLEVQEGRIYISGKETNLSELKSMIGESKYILQEKITNHHIIRKIYPNSLNTIRLHTVLKPNGEAEFFSAVHRFGANGSFVDNGCAGGMLVGISEKGILNDVAFFEPNGKNRELRIEIKHPNTKIQFAHLKLPYWDEILKTALEFHRFMYGIPSIGWDIAITENGFVFNEAGEDWEIGLDQIANGPQRKHFYETHGYALNVKLRHC